VRTLPSTRVAALAALACGLLALAVAGPGLLSGGAALSRAGAAEGDWFGEFEAVCSRTQDAMTIPSDELRSLVARCDKLKPVIAALDESRRKVYAKRLKLCRDLYEFVLASREGGEPR
jgi:hypothetical protein